MRQIRTVIGATTIDPKLLIAAERLQDEGYLRREETNVAILALSKSGTPIKEIVRQTGYSRKLVRQAIRGERHDVFRIRQSSLDQHLPWLDDQWASGCRNGAELWRRLKARGFRGSLRVISEWATRRRRAEKTDAQNLQRIPSARKIARLMTIGRDLLTKAETAMVAAIEAGVPTLVEAREIITQFHLMIRRRVEAGLVLWIEHARASLIASFANGVAKDEAAVRAAITSSSNGQTYELRSIQQLFAPKPYRLLLAVRLVYDFKRWSNQPAMMGLDVGLQMIRRSHRIEVSMVPEPYARTRFAGQIESLRPVLEQRPHVWVQLSLDAPSIPGRGGEQENISA
jgi:hypothetical protein